MSEILCKGSKDRDRPLRIRERSPLWDQERSRSLDQRVGEQGSSDEREAKVKSQPSDLIGERSTARRHCREPSCTGVNSPRRSHNPNHGFTEGLHVSVRRIVG
jgi:hypothetical protein